MRALLTLAFVAVLEGVVFARGYQDLGTLERQVVDDALAMRQLTLEPEPDGKVIGTVHVVNLDVFSPRDYFFQFFNRFHFTTHELMVRREALFRAGQKYEQTLIDETTRRLESPVYTSALGIVPVKSPIPGQVDVLIATRDLWSLRFNTNFEFQEGKLIALAASLAENNLFGWRKSVALVSDLDQGRFAIGPTYVDPNIAGTRLTATGSASVSFSRQTHQSEGYAAGGAIAYPLFSLASKWGGSVSYSYSEGVARSFLGTKLRKVPLFNCTPPNTECAIDRDWVYRTRSAVGQASATRRLGAGPFITDISAGYRFFVFRPTVVNGFPPDPPEYPGPTREFLARVAAPSALSSSVFLSASAFTPRYRIYRDLNTFDLRENSRLGPSAAVSARQASKLLGSDRDFLVLDASVGWAADLWDGYQAVSLGWGSRFQSGPGFTDERFTGGFYLASPVLGRAVRVVAAGNASILLDDTQNSFVALGGDTGLRGYTIGDFLGLSSMRGNLEVRSMALSVLSLRAGGLVFYDVGDAATPEVAPGGVLSRAVDTLKALTPHHDVGFGLRVLIPQFNTYVLRVDWAFALQNTAHTRAGWPGRFSAGFSQVF